MSKICNLCKIDKSVEFYYNYTNGYASMCKKCLLIYIKAKIECDCGSFIMRKNMSRHKNSNIHKKLLEVAG